MEANGRFVRVNRTGGRPGRCSPPGPEGRRVPPPNASSVRSSRKHAGAEGDDGDAADDGILAPGRIQLQASWEPGRVVVWAAGPGTPLASSDHVTGMLAEAHAPAQGWTRHAPVPVPGVGNADALAI